MEVWLVLGVVSVLVLAAAVWAVKHSSTVKRIEDTVNKVAAKIGVPPIK